MLFSYYLLLLSAIEPISRVTTERNNVCKSFSDYYFPEGNENCYYDPDTRLETPELIEKYAGIIEVYDVTSEDGYILKMFRIPRKNPKGVILLHHSIATYSHIYLWQGNHSLAISLWREGFDVWLANQRGTTYSDKHINMTSSDYDYWNFSFHEMGLYDVSSEVKLIRDKTNRSKIIYFGHSLGSAMGLVYSSIKNREASEYLKCMVLLAAPSYFRYSKSPIIYPFTFLGPLLEAILETLHIGSPLLMYPLILRISRIFTRIFPVFLYVVNVFVWISCGYTPLETDPTFFNYDAAIYSNNFSWKTLLHFAQLADVKNKFQMYDYGKEENLKIYGKPVPALYPLEKITVPTLLVSSFNDTLISLEDTDDLFQELPTEAKVHGHWKLSGLNHLDYLLGLHRKEIIFDKLINFLNTL